MDKDAKIFFRHILESIENIEAEISGMQKEDFLKDARVQNLIIRYIEIIGEAATNIPEDTRKKHSYILWRDIMDMRNKLIHEYFGVDTEIVWKTAKYDVLELKEQVDKILKL